MGYVKVCHSSDQAVQVCFEQELRSSRMQMTMASEDKVSVTHHSIEHGGESFFVVTLTYLLYRSMGPWGVSGSAPDSKLDNVQRTYSHNKMEEKTV